MIEELRAEIDEIDERIVELVSRRARTAIEIGRHKKSEGMGVRDRDREEIVLSRVKGLNSGPFSDEQIDRIYRKVISETRSIQMEDDQDDSRNET